jgi:8-oxo-dGTP pyrophosphatase MutT (NUDIX family)
MTDVKSQSILNYIVYRGLHLRNRLFRPLTLGVRAAVIDAADRVLLVRHTYVPGWHLPGGGIEPGESARAALAHELLEEANIELTGTPVPHGMFFNDYATKRDHVFVYVVRDFRQIAPRKADMEILEAKFFPWNGLPDGATAATRARVAEIFAGAPLSETW